MIISRSYDVTRAIGLIKSGEFESLDKHYSEAHAYDILDGLFPDKFIGVDLESQVSKNIIVGFFGIEKKKKEIKINSQTQFLNFEYEESLHEEPSDDLPF